jgi:hypothetical protein
MIWRFYHRVSLCSIPAYPFVCHLTYLCVAQAPSPRRAVHVCSPVKYINGQIQMPVAHQHLPSTAFKPISSYDVIEGSVDRKTYTTVGFKPQKHERQLTESNFFSAQDK